MAVFILLICQAVIWQSSGSHLAVIWQSSGSHPAVIRQSFKQSFRQSSGSHPEVIIRQSSGSHQAVIRQSSGSYKAFIRQSFGSHQKVLRYINLNWISVSVFVYFLEDRKIQKIFYMIQLHFSKDFDPIVDSFMIKMEL